MGLLNDFADWVVGQMSSFDYVGIGDSSTAYSSSQSGLQGSNTHYEPAESGYPDLTGNTLTTKIIVASGDAQFSWQEVVICTGTPGDVANRLVHDFGTKGATEWELTLELTINIA